MTRYLIVTFFLLGYQGFAQVFYGFSGGISDAMGSANVTCTNSYASFNNIGALGWKNEGNAFFLGYKNQFLIPDLRTIYVGSVHAIKRGTACITLARFGGSLYHETLFGIGMSHKLSNVSIGLKINYLQVSAQNSGTRRTWVGELGGRMLLRKNLAIGAYIYNFNRAKVVHFNDERHPIWMKAGFSYFPSQALNINFQIDKDIDFSPMVRVGIAYQVTKKIVLRVGVSNHPYVATAGLGLKLWNFAFDYAYQTHTDLQASNTLSMTYQPKKLKWK